MKRINVVAAIALFALAGACTQTSNADVTTKRLSIVGQDGQATTFEMVDLGKEGFGPADQLIEENPVTTSGGKKLGTAYTLVTMTSGKDLPSAKGLIDCHIVLSGGTILFNGSVVMAKLGDGVTLPVIGGTGAYAGAGGTVRMQAPDDKHTNMSFSLLIPKVSA